MADLSNDELGVEGEYGECLVCGESFHWEQLTNTEAGSYCDDHVPKEPNVITVTGITFPDEVITVTGIRFLDEADMGHDTALERDTFGDAT